MGLYTLPADTSSKNKTFIKTDFGRWVSTPFKQKIHLKIKQLSKPLG